MIIHVLIITSQQFIFWKFYDGEKNYGYLLIYFKGKIIKKIEYFNSQSLWTMGFSKMLQLFEIFISRLLRMGRQLRIRPISILHCLLYSYIVEIVLMKKRWNFSNKVISTESWEFPMENPRVHLFMKMQPFISW